MTVTEQIEDYLLSVSEPKQSEMRRLHQLALEIKPSAKLWFEDGRNSDNKVVSNPNIGYGSYTIQYANGKTKEFFRVGLSANTVGISVYIMGLEDKNYLTQTFGKEIGKASISGYCIKFKSLNDINATVLKVAMQYGLELKQ